MMEKVHEFSRTELILGKDGLSKLKGARVLLFGLGGVGSYVAEGLVRAGVGSFVLVDNDTISLTNRNRQLPALSSTMGRMKTEVVAERIKDINPQAQVELREIFYLPDHGDDFFDGLGELSYVVDAIDTITAKIDIACQCNRRGIPIIASMGTGNKLDPTRFEVADIYDTSVDPLARVLRKKLKERGIKGLKVVYSKEQPLSVSQPGENPDGTLRRAVPGSVSFVPSVAGLIIAGEVVKDIVGVISGGK